MQKMLRTIGFSFLTPILAIIALGVPRQSDQPKKAMEHSFKAATNSFMTAIKESDVATVTRFIPGSGVGLGHAGPGVSRDQLLTELKGRTGFYCDLFGGSCIDGEFERHVGYPPSHHIPSYRELLIQPGVVSIKQGDLDFQNGYWWGELTLKRRHPVEELATYYYFDFMQQNQHWYLMSIWGE
jgi:hypothetical protein